MSKTYAEMIAESEAADAALLATEPTPEEMNRLRSPGELKDSFEATNTYAIGAMVWDKNFNYKGAKGAWLSRTVDRNVQAGSAKVALRHLMTNPNMSDLHLFPEGF